LRHAEGQAGCILQKLHQQTGRHFQKADFPDAIVVEIRKGEILFSDGDAFNGFAYLMLHGAVDVLIRALDGNETMLYRLHDGHLLGELGFTGEPLRTATIVAAESCRLLRISAADWQRAQSEDGFSDKLYQSLYERFIQTHQVVRRLGQGKVLHRLGVYLLGLPQWRESEEDFVDVRLPTHAVLASLLNCTRERVTRLLQVLTAAGGLEKGEGLGRMRIFRSKLAGVLMQE